MNEVKIRGIVQMGYQGKPAVFQMQTQSGQWLTKFTIKHTEDGRSMFVNAIKWGDKPPTMTLDAGMDILITGKLTTEQRDKDGIKSYHIAISPTAIQVFGQDDNMSCLKTQPAAQPEPTQQLQESKMPDHDIPDLPDRDEAIPF